MCKKELIFSFITVTMCSLFNTTVAFAVISPPINSTPGHAYSAFNGVGNHMYHAGLDYPVAVSNKVTAGVSGKVIAISGLESGGDNDCLNGEEKIYIWDQNSTDTYTYTNQHYDLDKDGNADSFTIKQHSAECTSRKNIDNHNMGISVIVEHDDENGDASRRYSFYAHLSQVSKDIWDAYKCLRINASSDCGAANLQVNANDYIGRSGGSGANKLGYWPHHLHYEVRSFKDIGALNLYYSYTPDIPTAYGYEDPRSYYYLTNDSELFAGGRVIKVGSASVSLRSGPGKKYSVLGRTGANQYLVADRKTISTIGQNGGDEDVITGRDWYRIQLPNRYNIKPVYGWVAATGDDSSANEKLVEEQTNIPIYTVVNASSTAGWPLVIDYSATTTDPTLDCIERVATLTNNNCVRVWDNSQRRYLSAKVWNGIRFAVVPDQNAAPLNQYDPVVGPGGREWHQIYVPSIYFTDPAATGSLSRITRAWLPSSTLKETTIGRGMNFEGGTEQAPIKSSIPGLEFSTTDGYDWVYGDWRAGYNGPYPNGSYFSNGNFFAWLGVNQGIGRIDFIGGSASALSLGYSSYSTVTLEACSNSSGASTQLCSDGTGKLVDEDVGSGNLDTGRLDRLSVQDPSMDYVLFHDTGNFWLIDDLAVVDLLADTSILVPSDYDIIDEKVITTNNGDSTIINFLVDSIQSNKQSVSVVLNWAGSEFRLKVYDPNDNLVGLTQSNSPPITLTIPSGDIGNWSAEITAVDVPSDGYPVSFVVAKSNVLDSDADGVENSNDNCVLDFNPGQSDFDNDGYGDACDTDDDNDSVLDENDVCPQSTFPESVLTTDSIRKNRWALSEDGIQFLQAPPQSGSKFNFSTTDTGGCSCSQIVSNIGVGDAHLKYGCSTSVMSQWISTINGN